jgi:endonuclease/exonuclease/phosphatase family metal-dependent hydrolase
MTSRTVRRRVIGSIEAACLSLVALVLVSGPVAAQTPGPASGPVPANGAVQVPLTTALSWTAAPNATRYDVRLGTTTTPPIVERNHNETSYQPPAPLAPSTTYYWRIDARGRGNANTPGPLWSFTTAAASQPAPSAPNSPAPPNAATNVAVATTLGWAASTNATAYEVAFGTTNTPPVVSANQTGTAYDPPGDLAASTTYFWRITAKGPGGSTVGPLWSFTTAAAPVSTTLDRLRLMTWNVRMGLDNAGAANVDAQVELMADSGAHVIVLQEVTITAQANLPALYPSKLQALTGKTWNSVWAPAPGGTASSMEGNLILTMLPVASSSTIQIDSAPGDPSFLDAKRSAAQVGVVVNGVTVNVFGTHLGLSATHRQAQLDTLQTWVSTFAEPRLIGGDFNMVAGESAHTDMAGLFTDVWPVLGGTDPGYTKDARSISPFQPGRIDYWWQEKVDASARATEVWVVKTRRSDHHALLIDVEVK